MNYLELVNKVLKKLREDPVGTVSESNYSALIGEFINEAKYEVESAWNWATLRTSLDIPILSNITRYDTGLSTSSVLEMDPDDRNRPMAFCTNVGFSRQLGYLKAGYITRERILNEDSVTDTVPQHFALEAENGNWVVQLLVRPVDTLNYRFYFKVPQEELDIDTDVLSVPWRPVLALANMYALNERGEEIGEPGNIAEKRYLYTLANAISLEAVQSSEQLVIDPE